MQSVGSPAVDSPLIRCVVVGDVNGGKKCLAARAQTGVFPTDPPGLSHSLLHYFGTVGQLRLFVVSPSAVAGVQKVLTAYKEPMEVRSLAYEHADVILFCFPIGTKNGNYIAACNATFKRWGAELRAVSQMRPVLLIGTMEDHLSESDRSRAHSAGVALARCIEAGGYVQCSAEQGSGVDLVMAEALRLGQVTLSYREEARKLNHRRCPTRRGRRKITPCHVM